MLLDRFNIRRGVAFGPVAAAAGAISPITSAIGGAKSLFGGGGTSYSPSSSNSMQGYAALPQYLKDIYEKQYTPAVMDYFNSPEGKTPNPIAPFNPAQQTALQGFAQNIQQIQSGLQDYMNPYNQFVTDQIKRNYGMQQNSLMGNAQNANGIGALKSSSLGTQLALNNESMQRALAEAQYNAYKEALGLRRETLADILESGMMQQKQQQNEMTAQAQNPLSRVRNLGDLLKLIPSSTIQSQTGEMPAMEASPNRFQRAGAYFNELGNMGKQGRFAPSIFNSMFGR